MAEIIFGVDILQHLKKQLAESHLTPENRKELEGIIKHLEAGGKFEDYRQKV